MAKGVLSSDKISLLNQLVISMEEAELKLEEAYRKKKVEQFNIIKKFILKLQVKISEVVG